MPSYNARLKRSTTLGSLSDWVLVEDAENPDSGFSDPVVDYGVRDRLDAGLDVRDDYPAGEVLADQTGANNVLTFTFSAEVQTLWVTAVYTSDREALGEVRVDPFGGTPSNSLGIPVSYGSTFPIPAVCTVVQVYAPSGVRVTLYGNRR